MTRPVPPARPRAGRRERPRFGPEPTFLERNRSLIVTVAGIAIVVIVGAFLFVGATKPAYACSNIFDPSPTPTVDPSSSTRLGFLEEDMGNSHIVNPPQSYLYCPPASGNHYNQPGTLGPIPARVYRPDDKVGPSNWIHNLEHGGMVILYRSDSPGATAAGLQAFRDYFQGFPASPVCKVPAGQVSPVVARFDDMPHPYAALVWDRVLYMDTWDPALATRFYLTEAERLDATGVLAAPPEKLCAGPSAIPAPSAATPSGSAAASGSPGAAPSDSPAAPAPSSSPTAS
ncbi:MAG TPA: DUF3105 domain-containing protein [Candidatus Limnocylindrales bacterium]|nr:DUF3105 domain-containing protein [Candidatus Limnocylindrales bacterium]